MSRSAYWRLMPADPPPPEDADYALAHKLCAWVSNDDTYPYYGEHNALRLTQGDQRLLGYLEGLRDAQVDGARELIDALQLGDVALWWEY